MSKLQPSSIENLQGELATCNNVDDVDLSQLSRLVEHVPEDMTATVEAGMTLVDFQQHLAKRQSVSGIFGIPTCSRTFWIYTGWMTGR